MNENGEVEILLVEDNRTDADLTLRALIKSDLGNNVVWVKDGAEALDFMFRTGSFSGRSCRHPRLILLDLRLPKIDGIEVLRRLKSDARTKSVPVVILTASGEGRDIAESYSLGANSYLVKPVDLMQFSELVSQAGLYWGILNKTPEFANLDIGV